MTTVRLSEVLSALSFVLDMVEGQPEGQVLRFCFIEMTIAGRLQLSEEQRSAFFYALLLKDAGCSSNAWKVTALFGADDFDALSQDRPYRPAMPMEKVLTILQEGERPKALFRVRRSPGGLGLER